MSFIPEGYEDDRDIMVSQVGIVCSFLLIWLGAALDWMAPAEDRPVRTALAGLSLIVWIPVWLVIGIPIMMVRTIVSKEARTVIERYFEGVD